MMTLKKLSAMTVFGMACRFAMRQLAQSNIADVPQKVKKLFIVTSGQRLPKRGNRRPRFNFLGDHNHTLLICRCIRAEADNGHCHGFGRGEALTSADYRKSIGHGDDALTAAKSIRGVFPDTADGSVHFTGSLPRPEK